ncbi:DUF2795 domain-containing protein [Methanoculleus sp.]|uniref:DUF2795 domain-containing protein n=1 Tax=Methanoculleus sp. TaxID=90427 RepID=UPI0025E90A24|nr:DUF2795 domain-containing protein [Methanoculleus sp.]
MAERQAGSVLETRPRLEERIDLMRARDVRDFRVENPEGEHIGDLTDVAIDRDSGCIAYGVLSHGGILGFGEKHFAIPWEAIRTRPGERVAIVDTDKRTLDNASGFTRDRMPREGDWSLIRTPPPVRGTTEPSTPVTERERPPSAVGAAAAGAAVTGAAVTGATATGATASEEPKPAARESYVPVPPPVQTVAPGWGGEQRAHTAEERAEAFPRETVVEEVRRERPVETKAPPREVVVEEVRRERPAEMETRPVTEVERSLTTPGPTPGRLSAADLQVYLKGMDYPAGREDLVTHARRNNAPESVTTVLEGFSDRTYRSAAEVSEEFGRESRGERPREMEPQRYPETGAGERPEARRTVPSRARLSAADLQTYLKGMDYPAGRQDLAAHARRNNAPESVITAIEGFSDRTYQSAADVSVEFGRESRGEHPGGMETRQYPETGVRETRHEEPVRTETVTREQPETRRTVPSHVRLSAADLQTYLKGIDYPAGREDLVAHARRNNAPESVVSVLEQFSDRTYRSAAEVSEEFGNVR